MSGVEVASKLRRFQVDRFLNQVNELCGGDSGFAYYCGHYFMYDCKSK